MCGIVALFAPRGAVSPAAVERATQQLVRRGPDGQRQWIAPHGRVGLGHARLSIIDLQTGDQPIANEDGRLHIVESCLAVDAGKCLLLDGEATTRAADDAGIAVCAE